MGHLSGIFGRWTYPIVIGAGIALFVTGTVNDLVGIAVANAAALIPTLALLVLVVGALAVIAGVLLSIHKHDQHNAHGIHMMQRGVLAIFVGAVIAAGGLGMVWSWGNAAVVKLEAKVDMKTVPAALKVTMPATTPAPAATPITVGQR